jgi:hypothetical protein
MVHVAAPAAHRVREVDVVGGLVVNARFEVGIDVLLFLEWGRLVATEERLASVPGLEDGEGEEDGVKGEGTGRIVEVPSIRHCS